ncbi:MAG: hypothetical protein AAFR58_12480 [Cyanobacteria bacterium J06627_28]
MRSSYSVKGAIAARREFDERVTTEEQSRKTCSGCCLTAKVSVGN